MSGFCMGDIEVSTLAARPPLPTLPRMAPATRAAMRAYVQSLAGLCTSAACGFIHNRDTSLCFTADALHEDTEHRSPTMTQYATPQSIVPGTHQVADAAAALVHALPGGESQSTPYQVEWQGSRDGGLHVTVFSEGCDEGTDFIVRVERA